MDWETATQLYGKVHADKRTRAVRTVSESGEAPQEQILPPLQVGAACNRPSTAPPA